MGLDINTLLASFPSGIAQGILWGIMALGLYITFRLLNFADMTVDGTFTTGGAVTVMLIINGWNPWLAVIIAFFAGVIAGIITGILHTKLGIPAILAGILTQFALWSVNLAIMGFSANKAISVNTYALAISSRFVTNAIVTGFVVALVVIGLMYWYFGTEHGSSMRATGNNSEMAKAQGIDINHMKVIGLALSNGLVALSGGLMSQYQGFADINMGRGAIVIGLAAIIIGEVVADILAKKHTNFALRLAFVIIGGILYYMVIQIVLWLRLNSNLLRLFTAIVVAVFLAVPYLISVSKVSFKKAHKNSLKEVQ